MTEFRKVFIDTAPFIYYLEQNPDYFEKSKEFFLYCYNNRIKMVTSTITLEEYFVYPYRNHQQELIDNFEDFISTVGIDVLDINRNTVVFLKEGRFVKVRLLKTKHGTVSGYYDDMEKLIKDIRPYDGVNNVFFTMNQLTPDKEQRSLNRLTKHAKNTTSDSEINRRRWVLIDLDPERKSRISNTEDELNKAFELSNTI